jgi:hypothetical protein
MSQPIVITKMVQTCWACPSQWDGWDANGVYYYFRYRWGHLSIRRDDVLHGDPVFDSDVGDAMDGFMSYPELRDLMADVLTLPDACE